MIIYILILWVVLLYTDFRLTKRNMSTPFNGFGSIDGVLSGKSFAPMQYRVLVPWLFKLIDNNKMSQVRTYLMLKQLSMLVALVSSYIYFGALHLHPILPMTLLVIFFIWVALYDYTDVYIEIAILSACFSLMILQPSYWVYVTALLCFVGALNRETIIVVPIVLFLNGSIFASSVAVTASLCGVLWPIFKYGKVKRYCGLNMLPNNIKQIKETYSSVPHLLNEYSMFFILLFVSIWLYATIPELSPIDIGVGLICLALLIPTKWCEIRVFAPISLSLIPQATRLLT